MWLLFDFCVFVAFVVVGGDMQLPTQQLSLRFDPMQCNAEWPQSTANKPYVVCT